MANFHNTIEGTLHKLSFFFPIKTDDETTILVVYDIYFINQLLKNENNKNKQTNAKRKQKRNQLKKQSDKQRSIEIVHKSLLHIHLVSLKGTDKNGDFNKNVDIKFSTHDAFLE